MRRQQVRNHVPDCRELRRAGEALLQEMDLPQPLSIGALSDMIRQARGRPLVILPLPLPSGSDSPYGLWAEYPDADFILHEAGTSPAHRDQIILHEIAHMLLGRNAEACFHSSGGRPGSGLAPDLNSQAAGTMTRGAYSSAVEWQAEVVASLLMERMCGPAACTTQDYRALQALRPLWSRLTAAVPHVVLGHSPSHRDDLRAVGTDLRFRLWRRIVEIRDAALLLRSHVSDDGAASARAMLRSEGLAGEELDAATEAAWLRAALTAHLAGQPPLRPAPVRQLHGGTDMTAEARWLMLVAAAWDALPTQAPPRRSCLPQFPDSRHALDSERRRCEQRSACQCQIADSAWLRTASAR